MDSFSSPFVTAGGDLITEIQSSTRNIGGDPLTAISSDVPRGVYATTGGPANKNRNNASGGIYMAFEEYFPTTVEYEVLKWLEFVCPPVLVAVGCAGNALTSALLSRSAFRGGVARDGRRGCSRGQQSSRLPVFDYLSALCGVSVVHLVLGRGLDWFMFVAGLPSIVETAELTCRLWQAFSGVVRHTAGWMVVGMLAERYLAETTGRSTSSDAYCIASHAKAVIVAILVGLGVINVHSLWIYELLPDGQCNVNPRRTDFEAVGWPWINTIVAVHLPVITGLTLSTLLAVRRRRAANVTRPSTDGDDRSSDVEQAQASTSVDPRGNSDLTKRDEAELTGLATRLGILYPLAAILSESIHIVAYLKPAWIVQSNRALSVLYTTMYIGALGADLVVPALTFVVALASVTSLRIQTGEMMQPLRLYLDHGCGFTCGRLSCRFSFVGTPAGTLKTVASADNRCSLPMSVDELTDKQLRRHRHIHRIIETKV